MKKICYVVSSEMTIKAFLKEQLRDLGQEYDLTVVVHTENKTLLDELSIKGSLITLELKREISILADIKALFELVSVFKKNKYDLVHSITPKAGLLCSWAAKIAGIRDRIHTFTGQVWANKKGIKRIVLKIFDKVIAYNCSHLLADSFSQRDFIVEEGVVRKEKINVLANGSISGVDLDRFVRNEEERASIRRKHNISDETCVILFLGRLKKDKGVLELLEAFNKMDNYDCVLMLVGPDEDGIEKDVSTYNNNGNIIRIGYTDKPEDYFSVADIFCLPSHREGFGTVIIEAAAAKLPSVASNIYGVRDAVVDAETGLLHEKGNAEDIKDKLAILIENKALREEYGNNAYKRAHKLYNKAVVNKALYRYYKEIL